MKGFAVGSDLGGKAMSPSMVVSGRQSRHPQSDILILGVLLSRQQAAISIKVLAAESDVYLRCCTSSYGW